MRRIFTTVVALATLLSLVLVFNVTSVGATSLDRDNGKLEHIFYIMMENHATDEIFGNTADAPYTNWLASQYAISTDYFGVTHPSSPNYLAAISGDFQHIWDDCAAGPTVMCAPTEFSPTSGYTNGQELLTPAEIARATSTPHWFNDRTIVDQLEAHGLSWKAYMQSMPYAGFTGAAYPIINGSPVQLYVQKHNPFEYFTGIRNNPARMQDIVPFNQLDQDLDTGNVPNFVWISPDTCHDMHGISPSSAPLIGNPACAYPASGLDHSIIQLGDTFLKSTVSEIMESRAWSQRSAIVIVWDENDFSGFTGCCHSPTGVNGVTLGGANAPAIVITSKDRDHFTDSTTPYNHYSLLATIEHLWGLGCLENSCGFSNSELMTRFFV
ncbi:MAG TPA: alkaline phosphatase family protein [Ktedonobacteraceae bacterium]|nr:alkaline phosphatase family protein [Ktedonobacteraceae bacterium]